MIPSLNSGAGARRLAVWDNGPVTRALLLAAVLIFPSDILACSAGPLVVLPGDGDGDGEGDGEGDGDGDGDGDGPLPDLGDDIGVCCECGNLAPPFACPESTEAECLGPGTSWCVPVDGYPQDCVSACA